MSESQSRTSSCPFFLLILNTVIHSLHIDHAYIHIDSKGQGLVRKGRYGDHTLVHLKIRFDVQ